MMDAVRPMPAHWMRRASWRARDQRRLQLLAMVERYANERRDMSPCGCCPVPRVPADPDGDAHMKALGDALGDSGCVECGRPTTEGRARCWADYRRRQRRAAAA